MIIYGSDNPYKHDVSIVGGKGRGLYKLIEYGLRVPDFFVIAAGTDIKSPDFLRELDEYAQRLGGDVFSVRSSGVSEDGESASFAGQYGTELNVARGELAEAVYKVYASKDDRSVKAYSKRTDGRSCEMAVIVQRQITGSESGVMFSTSPQEPNVTLIESVRGGGESLVSGAASPDKRRYGRKENACGYDKELLAAAMLLENGESGPVDVEFTYDGTLWFLQLRSQTAVSDVMPEIKGGKWDLYVFRDFTVFSHSVQERAAQADVQRELFGFSTPIVEGVWACGREFYSEKNDVAQIGLWSELDGDGFFDRFETNIKRIVGHTKRRCAVVKNKDYSRLTDAALFSAYEREITAYIESYVPMMMRPDDYLYDRSVHVCGKARADALVAAVKSLLPPTYYSEEHTSFLRAVISGDTEAYLAEYEWKNNPLGKRFTPLTEREFDARANGMTVERAKERLDGILRKRREERKIARRKSADMSEREAELADLISRFVYYRTLTAENSDRYFFYIRKNILREIARRVGLNDEKLLLYRWDEVPMLCVGERLDERELNKRRNGDAVVFENGSGKAYYGSNAYALLKRLLPPLPTADVVYGEIACAGRVTGKVKIVNGLDDAEKTEAGSILVSSMTTPDLTLAMERASGIITDEGGITCHAAIIAREYAVPCLVGTKVATQKLCDGMTVELDCINGYFRIADGG